MQFPLNQLISSNRMKIGYDGETIDLWGGGARTGAR